MNGFIIVKDFHLNVKEVNLAKNELENLGLDLKVVELDEIRAVFDSDMNKINVSGEWVDCPDVIFATLMSEKDFYHYKAVLRMFESLGAICVNSWESIEKAVDKLYTFQIIRNFISEIKIPKTMLITKNSTSEEIQEIINFPLVLKPNSGSKGSDVVLIETKEELDKILTMLFAGSLDYELLAQEAIMSSKGRDIRVIVYGGEVLHSFVRTNDNDFRSNLHQGGRILNFDPPTFLIDASSRISDIFGLKICSIDYLFGETEDEYYLGEVNSFPGFKYLFEAQKTMDTELFNKVNNGIKKILKL
ncbi:MAG: RimK family alpha-L-glutamate ligase [Methanobrevibacter sp.]|jgi:RimK family alpha-L-glutamate ligase|nr:RimK family alpha-L-glutamate ligase [Candidatus Methanovirga basalitermitum]